MGHVWTPIALKAQEVVGQSDSPDGPTEETRSTWSYPFAPDGCASCLLLPDRLEGSLDEIAASHRSRYEPVLVEMSSVELPLGRAVRFVLKVLDDGEPVCSRLLTCVSLDVSHRAQLALWRRPRYHRRGVS